MNRRRTLIVLMVFAVAALTITGSYVRRARSAAQAASAITHARTLRGVLPPTGSTVPGVTLTSRLITVGDHEIAELTIQNNTDQAIEAFEISADPQGRWAATQMSLGRDARDAQRDGEVFNLEPEIPVIPPHSGATATLGLLSVADDSNLTLTAVSFQKGLTAGRRAKEFENGRINEADRHGLGAEVRALNARRQAQAEFSQPRKEHHEK